MSGEESDLADDIVPETVPQHIPRASKSFAPWHKVRKQLVRCKQWNHFTVQLAERYLKADIQDDADDWSIEDVSSDRAEDIPEEIRVQRPLRCLVIPGEDLLDIRSLYQDSRYLRCWIQYLGFNERCGSDEQGTRIYIANNEVKSLFGVVGTSQVLRDHFQAVKNQHSQAYRLLREYGPYHVVNLDLCDSLFPKNGKQLADYVDALHRLLHYQFESQTVPWVLFVTTEIASSEIDVGAMRDFCKPTRLNFDRHKEFAEALLRLLPKESFDVDANGVIKIETLNGEQINDLFGVAFGKFLLHLANSAVPAWRIDMLPSQRYTINQSKSVRMVSLAFQFRRLTKPPQDATGLSTINIGEKQHPSELQLALKIVERVGQISDLDRILEDDPTLREQMTQSSADLLESAGYDREAYLRWVQEGEGSQTDDE